MNKLRIVSIAFLALVVFVGCTSNDTNGNNNTTSSQATSGSSSARADETLEEDGVKIELFNTAESSWDYVLTTDLPTPCHELEIDAMIAESFPEQVTFNVNIVSPDAGVQCAQVIEPIEESGQLAVNEDARFSLKVTRE